MSVLTTVSPDQMREYLKLYDLGQLRGMRGIQAGVTNTNYFVDTDKGRYVLTVFETLKLDEIPYFMKLKLHLNSRGVACPEPIALKDGRLCAELLGKPAALISRLKGAETARPNAKQCRAVGAMQAKMHLAGEGSDLRMKNPRGFAWCKLAYDKVKSKMEPEESRVLGEEIRRLSQALGKIGGDEPGSVPGLPWGPIHADLFKDNVLLDGNEVAGFIDFYYACDGYFAYDLAVSLNDWARDPDSNAMIPELEAAFMAGYESVRPLNRAEKDSFLDMRRWACVRFWASRLLDWHFPPEGELTYAKDPTVFRDLLLAMRRLAGD